MCDLMQATDRTVSPRPPQALGSLSDRAALTLLEVVLATAFLVAAYVPLIGVYHLSLVQTTRSRSEVLARSLATSIFECYEVQPDLFLRSSGGTGTLVRTDVLDDPVLSGALHTNVGALGASLASRRFAVRLEIQRSVGGRLGFDRLEVTIRWTEDGIQSTRRYARLVCLEI